MIYVFKVIKMILFDTTYIENSFYSFRFKWKTIGGLMKPNDSCGNKWKELKNRGKLQTAYKSSSYWSIWFTESFTLLLLSKFSSSLFFLVEEIFVFHSLLVLFVCGYSHGKFIFRNMKQIFCCCCFSLI